MLSFGGLFNDDTVICRYHFNRIIIGQVNAVKQIARKPDALRISPFDNIGRCHALTLLSKIIAYIHSISDCREKRKPNFENNRKAEAAFYRPFPRFLIRSVLFCLFRAYFFDAL
jgi:hypothetical protein